MIVTITKNEEEFDRIAGWKIAAQILLKKNSVIGLSTGQTTGGMHKVASDIYQAHPFDTSQATIFGVDELALVPEDFPGTCTQRLLEQIVDPMRISRDNFIMPSASATNVEAQCEMFESELMRRGGIDLQMLGIGMDGHLGMNLPGTPFESRTRFTELSGELESRIRNNSNYPKPNPLGGITLGILTIMNIRHIVLVAKGAHKAQIIKEALLGPVTTDVPASILKLHPNCEFLLDPEAGALVGELAGN